MPGRCARYDQVRSVLDVSRVGQMLTELLKQPQEVGGHTVSTGASVGIFPEDASDAESL